MSPQTEQSIFIFAGEHSGDVHGAKLVQSLKELLPYSKIRGVSGPYMRAEGVDTFMEMEAFAVMGFTDVALALPKIFSNFKKIRNNILQTNPDMVILIDYQEFSLRLAKSLRKKGYTGKLVQYISPSVWAWRKGRADTIAENFDLLLTIYPFESQYYNTSKLSVKYIGNPIKDRVEKYCYDNDWRRKLDIPNKPFIALFPGSRKSEIYHNLPLQLKAAEKLKKHVGYFAISCASKESKKHIQQELRNSSLVLGEDAFLIPREYSYEVMRDSKMAIAKSGTVTLELALHKKPTIVTYDISKTHKFICKNILRINLPFYCIVNILANKEVFPEFVDAGINPNAIVTAAIEILNNPDTYRKTVDLCEKVRSILHVENSSGKSARAIQEAMQK
ncbi:MAG: lipid-A-disaccharide synthase [Chlamydiota bacterium]|nr:lipid-A-disaccharide synthase [Chlamydiota bacterium]